MPVLTAYGFELAQSLYLFFQAGEAYFVSDDSPVNNFEFFRPLVSDNLRPKLRFMYQQPGPEQEVNSWSLLVSWSSWSKQSIFL